MKGQDLPVSSYIEFKENFRPIIMVYSKYQRRPLVRIGGILWWISAIATLVAKAVMGYNRSRAVGFEIVAG